jgi:hypothetical protein
MAVRGRGEEHRQQREPRRGRVDLLRWTSSRRGHMTIGALTVLPLAYLALPHVVAAVAVVVGAVWGGAIPDVDWSPPEARFRPFRHRGAWHSPFAAALVSVPIGVGLLILLPAELRWGALFAAGLAVGYLMHLLVDWRRLALLVPSFEQAIRGNTPSPRLVVWKGHVSWSWPFQRRRRRPRAVAHHR